MFRGALRKIDSATKGGMVSARACFDENDYYVVEFLSEDGSRLSYEPWSGDEQDLLLDLTDRYGESLKRVIIETSSAGKMKLKARREHSLEITASSTVTTDFS